MAKIGRPKLVESPEVLWDYFERYKAETKNNPIVVQDFVGKDAEEVSRKKERPLTMEGFESFVFRSGGPVDLDQYFSNEDGRYIEFTAICRAIRREIRMDQIDGGMAGIYNPSITQRLNNLVERSEVKNTGTTVMLVENKPNEQNEPIKD